MNVILFYWWVIALASMLIATYSGMIWWYVRGLRGAALTVCASLIALIAFGMALLAADDAIVPTRIVAIVVRSLIPQLVLSVAVLADIYAADHNDHRSLTTKSYLWFKDLRKERYPK